MTLNENIYLILFVLNIGVAVLMHPRPLWRMFAISAAFWLIVTLLGCASNKPSCTWHCPPERPIPHGCYCLEDLDDTD